MNRIYFSKESSDKFKKHPLAKNMAVLQSKFDPHRPERRATQKRKTSEESIAELAQKLQSIRQAHGISEQGRESKSKISIRRKNKKERIARKVAKIKAEDKKLEKVRKNAKNIKITSMGILGVGLQLKKRTVHKNNTKEKPIYESNDLYDLAGEYSARNVEYGHGRHKSSEWNDSTARTLNKELSKLRKMRRKDPNIFDRGAMK